jgi:hypothetical protein
VRLRFGECFGEAAYKRLQEPIQKARASAKMGRFEMAAACYHEALALQPRNWVLLCEVSQFLTFQFRDPKSGADMASRRRTGRSRGRNALLRPVGTIENSPPLQRWVIRSPWTVQSRRDG